MFGTEHNKYWGDLKKEYQDKRDQKRWEKKRKRQRKNWEITLDRKMPGASRDSGRRHARDIRPDQKRRAKVAVPKPVKHKTSDRHMRYDGSLQLQAENTNSARGTGSLFTSSERNSPDSTYISQPNPPNRGDLRHATAQVDPTPLPRSCQGSILSRPVGSSGPSIRRNASGASSHWSSPRLHECPPDGVSPLNSPDPTRLSPHSSRSVSPLSLISSGHRTIPGIKITFCGPNHNSTVSQSSDHSHQSQNDRASLTSKSTYYTAPSADLHRPRAGYNNSYVPTTPELEARNNPYIPTTPELEARPDWRPHPGPPDMSGHYVRAYLERSRKKRQTESF